MRIVHKENQRTYNIEKENEKYVVTCDFATCKNYSSTIDAALWYIIKTERAHCLLSDFNSLLRQLNVALEERNVHIDLKQSDTIKRHVISADINLSLYDNLYLMMRKHFLKGSTGYTFSNAEFLVSQEVLQIIVESYPVTLSKPIQLHDFVNP